MQIIQKHIYIICSGILVLAFFVGTALAQNQQLQCPAGSYDAGGFCKQEPTGCPYADSIPKDSVKCVPPNNLPAAVTEGQNQPTPVSSPSIVPKAPSCQQ